MYRRSHLIDRSKPGEEHSLTISSRETNEKIRKRKRPNTVRRCFLFSVLVAVFYGLSQHLPEGIRNRGLHNPEEKKVCFDSLEEMPDLWRPLPQQKFDGSQWKNEEQSLADEATNKGFDELLHLLTKKMDTEQILDMGVDAANALIDEAYSTNGMPEFHRKALEGTWYTLRIIANDLMESNQPVRCISPYEALKFAGYSQYLANRMPENKELQDFHRVLVSYTQDVIDVCGNLDDLTEIRDSESVYHIDFDGRNMDDTDLLFSITLRVIAIIDASTVRPRLKFPPGADEFVVGYWKYVGEHHASLFPNARSEKNHYHSQRTREPAWVATHAAYVPTGYGRHKQYYRDAPWLYDYIRENLYYAMEFGMLDLVCEFVDIIRQYGCAEENDIQVRHSTRWVLAKFQKANHSWLNHKEPWQQHGEEISDYDLVHKPWTAISGTIRRDFDQVIEGSYGSEWMAIMQRTKTLKSVG